MDISSPHSSFSGCIMCGFLSNIRCRMRAVSQKEERLLKRQTDVINHDVQAVLEEHGASHFISPISHPASTRLLKRAVQEMFALISKKCIERGTTNFWGLFIRDNVLEMNTKTTRVHGYKPSRIMLGFEPQKYHFKIDDFLVLANFPSVTDLGQAPSRMDRAHASFLALREENNVMIWRFRFPCLGSQSWVELC